MNMSTGFSEDAKKYPTDQRGEELSKKKKSSEKKKKKRKSSQSRRMNSGNTTCNNNMAFSKSENDLPPLAHQSDTYVEALPQSSMSPFDNEQSGVARPPSLHRDMPRTNVESHADPAPQQRVTPAFSFRMAHKFKIEEDESHRPVMPQSLDHQLRGNSLEARLQRKMAAEFGASGPTHSGLVPITEMTRKFSQHQQRDNSLEVRLQRKMTAENGDSGPTHAGPAPVSAMNRRPSDLQQRDNSLAARLQRNMAAEYGDTGPMHSGPAPAPSMKCQPSESQGRDNSLAARSQRKMVAEYGNLGPTHSGPVPAQISSSLRNFVGASTAMEKKGQNRRHDEGLQPSSSRSRTPALLEMTSDSEETTNTESFRFSAPIVSVARPKSSQHAMHQPNNLPLSASMPAGLPGPGIDGPLAPRRALKERRGSLPMGVQPGAYSVQGRPIGALPAWGRRMREMGQNIRGSLRNIGPDENPRSIRGASTNGSFRGNMPNVGDNRQRVWESSQNISSRQRIGSDDQEHLPPEMRGIDQPSDGNLPLDVDDGLSDRELGTHENTHPQYRKKLYFVGVVLLACIGVGIGVGVPLSAGSGDSTLVVTGFPSPTQPSQEPSASPNCPYVATNFPQVIIDCACGSSITSNQTAKVSGNYFSLKYTDLFDVPDDVNSCLAENVALWWLANDTLYTDWDEQKRYNRFILVSLFVDWTGATPDIWNHRDRWLSLNDECTWFGLSCTNDTITSLNLTDNNLKQGNGLPLSLFELTGLVSLDLTKSYLQKSIPTKIEMLQNLEFLVLSPHKFTGILPIELFTLKNLKHLDLAIGYGGSQGLIGSLPQDIGGLTSLSHFALTNTGITGVLPREMYELSNLLYLNLGFNKFKGALSTEVGNLKAIKYLDLSGNQISGTLPSTLGNLMELMSLVLSNNAWVGPIPSTVSDLTKLRKISISCDHDGSCGLTGSIPTFLVTITTLSEVKLDFNVFVWSIPSLMGKLTNLESFSAQGNGLTGSIPNSFGSLTSLTFLNIGTNKLTGSIPNVLTKLPLKSVNLAQNNLTGMLPSGFGETGTIVCLDIRFTKINGRISTQVCSSQNGTTSLYVPCDAVLCTPDACCSCDENVTTDVCSRPFLTFEVV